MDNKPDPKNFIPIYNFDARPILDIAKIEVEHTDNFVCEGFMSFPFGTTKAMATEFMDLYIKPVFGDISQNVKEYSLGEDCGQWCVVYWGYKLPIETTKEIAAYLKGLSRQVQVIDSNPKRD